MFATGKIKERGITESPGLAAGTAGVEGMLGLGQGVETLGSQLEAAEKLSEDRQSEDNNIAAVATASEGKVNTACSCQKVKKAKRK